MAWIGRAWVGVPLALAALLLLLAALGDAQARPAQPAAFGAANLVVYRVGDGSTPLSGAAAAVWLDEYTPAGVLVQSLPLPVTPAGGQRALTAAGNAATEGLLTRSTDARFLALTGYDAPVGTLAVAATAAGTVNRVVGRVDPAGSIDTTTRVPDGFDGSSIRGAATDDGSRFWLTGTSAGASGGSRFALLGSGASTQLSTASTNLRGVQLAAGQLYVSSASGTLRLATVGTGTPTIAGQPMTNLPGFPTTGSPNAFHFADLDGALGPDTVYVADDGAGQVQKYTLAGGSWAASGSVAVSGARGLTGQQSGGVVTLYVTNGVSLLSLTDPSGHGGALSGAATLVATAPANTAFRGVAPAPVAGAAAATGTALAGNPTAQAAATRTAAAQQTAAVATQTALASLTICQLQGAGHLSPYSGQPVANVTGIVTVVRSSGFYLQDTCTQPAGASAGIFVFTNGPPPAQAAAGNAVRVAATVSEFRSGGAGGTAYLTTTELLNPTVTLLSSGNALPPPVVLGLGGRTPPTGFIKDPASVTTGDIETSGGYDPGTNALDFFESLEGMRVQVNNAVVVGPRNPQGEFAVLADDGAAAAARRTARGGVIVAASYTTGFNPDRIIVDDDLAGFSAPNVNVGDHFTGPIVGVLDYTLGNFKIEAVPPALTVVPGQLAKQPAPPAGPNELAIATFNVQNLDPGDGAPRFSRLADAIVNGLKSPDLIAVEEVQDNSGPVDDGTVDATTTLNTLIGAIATAGGPGYQARWIDPVNDQDGGEPGGNIRVAFLTRSDRGLTFVDRAGPAYPALATTGVGAVAPNGPVQLSFSPGRIDPTNAAFADSRKPLAAELTFQGRTLFVVANHFNSKTSDQPLFGRFQPPGRTSETQRLQQAAVVNGFVRELLAVDANAAVVVLGDLNDFEFSPSLAALKGQPAPVLTDLIETLPAAERYTYVFDGNSQALDHTLVSPGLAGKVMGYQVVHLNAEYYDTGTLSTANRVSDHDPQVLRLDLARVGGVTPTPVPSPAPAGALRFVAPVRVVDTRPSDPGSNIATVGYDGATGLPIQPGALAAGATRTFRLAGRPFGSVAVPAGATGVLLNVTVIQSAASGGFVTVYPGDGARPNTSTVNPSTAVAANFTAVALPVTGSGAGNLAVYSANAAHLAIDLVGYFEPPGTAGLGPAVGNARLTAPVRVLDTRPTDPAAGIVTTGVDAATGQPLAPGQLTPGTFRRFALAGRTFGSGAGQTTFPADLSGIIAHVTVVQAAPSGGFITLLPGDAAAPVTVSTVNPSTAVAFNGWAVGGPPPGSAGAGTFAVYSTNAADVLVDVVGYYAPSVGLSAGGALTLVTPVRVVDSRPSNGAGIVATGFGPDGLPAQPAPLPAGGTRRYRIAGATFGGLTIPADAKGVLANVTLVQGAAAGGFLTAFPGDVPDTQRPTASTVNPVTAIAASFWGTGLPLAGASNPGTLALYTTNPADVLVDVLGYFR